MWHVVSVAQRLVASPEVMYATTFCECTQQVSCLRRIVTMDGNIIYNISLGNLNPVNIWLSGYVDRDNEAMDHLRKVAKEIEHWHFGAGIALSVLADRIDLWRYDAVNFFTEDYARLADTRWVQVIDQLAAIASAPWCVGLEIWENTNLDDPYTVTRVVPFDLERLRRDPLDAKSRRGLRRVIKDLANANPIIQVSFPRTALGGYDSPVTSHTLEVLRRAA